MPPETDEEAGHGDTSPGHTCVVEVEMAVEVAAVEERIPKAHRDEVTQTATGCRVRVGGQTWDLVAWHLLWVSRDLGQPIGLGDSPEAEALRESLASIATQAASAVQRRLEQDGPVTWDKPRMGAWRS